MFAISLCHVAVAGQQIEGIQTEQDPHISALTHAAASPSSFSPVTQCLSQLNGPLSTGAHLCGVISLQGEGLAELSQRVEGGCVCLSALLDRVFLHLAAVVMQERPT